MKRRLNKKRVIDAVLVLVLIVCFVLFLNWFLKRDDDTTNKNDSTVETDNKNKDDANESGDKPINQTTYLKNITYTVSLDKELEEKIIEYMDLYYKSMKELKEYDSDMSNLFSNKEQALINNTAISLLVNIRKLKKNDLSLYSAYYDLDIVDVDKSGNSVSVKVLENSYLRFNFIKDIESKIYDIENDFTFTKVDGKWKISKYDKGQDFFVMVTDKYEGNGSSELSEIKADYMKTVKAKEQALEQDYNDYLNNTGITPKNCDHAYDRTKAYNYATSWVNKRNSNWVSYEANCQNFVSQVLYAGGIPMDHYGSADSFKQWKSYSGTYNEAEEASGLVYTWTSVPRFRYYVENNTGYGLCATLDENLYYAEAGDAIDVGTKAANRHVVIVIDTVKKDGKVIDVLVNSNTVDLENYPISAYVYPYVSLIKVYGWND